MLVPAINQSLNELIDLLSQLSDHDYAAPCCELSEATIGQHTRHIIEMFECLEDHYDSAQINYDNRERNILVETSTEFAIRKLNGIKSQLGRPNKTLQLQQSIGANEVAIESNYMRELLYNLEHCIHHQALIKVALRKYKVNVSAHFGVASSTIEYRNQCAQ